VLSARVCGTDYSLLLLSALGHFGSSAFRGRPHAFAVKRPDLRRRYHLRMRNIVQGALLLACVFSEEGSCGGFALVFVPRARVERVVKKTMHRNWGEQDNASNDVGQVSNRRSHQHHPASFLCFCARCVTRQRWS